MEGYQGTVIGGAHPVRLREVSIPGLRSSPFDVGVSCRGIVGGMPLSEKKLINQIRRMARARGSQSVRTGIGDDCAVLRVPPGNDLLVTTDFTIEKVHFRRDWHRPELVGQRCLTRGLSDIAAMGGKPQAAFLSLAVPSDLPQKWVDRFLKGLLDLAEEFKLSLAGGDTAESPRGGGIQADIVVVGSVPSGKAVLRSGAKPGERIYVTGELGGSATALARLVESKPVGAEYFRHFRPRARVAVGQRLRQRGVASAMIDLSDGLSTDLEHICQESHVGAEIEAEAIPRAQVRVGGNGSRSNSPCTAATTTNCSSPPPQPSPRRWREFE